MLIARNSYREKCFINCSLMSELVIQFNFQIETQENPATDHGAGNYTARPGRKKNMKLKRNAK